MQGEQKAYAERLPGPKSPSFKPTMDELAAEAAEIAVEMRKP